LNEIASVASRKFGKPIRGIRELLGSIRAVLTVHNTNLATHDRGLDIAERYRFSLSDSMLIAAALDARCHTFWSEDFQHGQTIEGLTIRDPFRS